MLRRAVDAKIARPSTRVATEFEKVVLAKEVTGTVHKSSHGSKPERDW